MPTVVKSRFPQIANELAFKVDIEVQETADDIAQGARHRVPVRTGALRRAIEARPVDLGKAEVRAWSDEAWYGHLVEFGTEVHEIKNAFGKGITVTHPGASPRPFLIPAAEAQREPFEHAVRKVLGQL